MVSCCTVPPNSKETEPGSRDQEASPSAGNNARIVLKWPWCGLGVDISKIPGCHFIGQMSSQ